MNWDTTTLVNAVGNHLKDNQLKTRQIQRSIYNLEIIDYSTPTNLFIQYGLIKLLINTMKYISITTPSDVKLLEPSVFGDHRGFFMETWQQRDFSEQVGEFSFVQDNHSKSAHGILRGLHYQIKQPQGKLVRVVQGTVFDVAVDMRKSSPTFGQWVGFELSEENKRMLWVPPGFAHGFYVMSKTAEFVYKCTDYYAPEYERSLLWNDPIIGIEWPLLNGTPPTLSDKDAKGDTFDKADKFE